VFPQLRGLGHSSMATFYGIPSLRAARDYLAHPILGTRLELCTQTVTDLESGSLHEIFGSPDDMKFQSSMTLFALAAVRSGQSLLQSPRSLVRWYHGCTNIKRSASSRSTPGGSRP
jgi:uncharacterized protein (DUF1810 family)